MKAFITGILLIVAGIVLGSQSDYMDEKRMRVTVLEKYVESGGYKRSSSPVMVLRTEDGRVFDTYVSYATHHLYGKGDVLVMGLREMDIQQTAAGNVLSFFVLVLVVTGISVAFIGAPLFWLLDR